MNPHRKYIFTQYYKDYLAACQRLNLNSKEAKHIWRWSQIVGLARNIPIYCYRPDAWNRDTHMELILIEQAGYKVEFVR